MAHRGAEEFAGGRVRYLCGPIGCCQHGLAIPAQGDRQVPITMKLQKRPKSLARGPFPELCGETSRHVVQWACQHDEHPLAIGAEDDLADVLLRWPVIIWMQPGGYDLLSR